MAVCSLQNVYRTVLLLEPDIFCEHDEDCVSSEKCQEAPSLDVSSSELSGGPYCFVLVYFNFIWNIFSTYIYIYKTDKFLKFNIDC